MNNSRFVARNRSPASSSREETAWPADASVNYEQLFVSQLPVVDRVISQVCHRHHLRHSEREEFASDVRLHLVERDYEVLRRFRQRSSLATYLTVVVQRQFLNYRNHVWGRWRPSAEAARLGPTAILLERLTGRDGWTFEEAQQQMRTNHSVEQTRDELYAIWLELSPTAAGRRLVPEDVASDVASPAPGPDANIVRAGREFERHRIAVALERAWQAATAEDRLLLKMRFRDGFTVSQIAATLHLKQKPLYRTFERLLARLRAEMQAD